MLKKLILICALFTTSHVYASDSMDRLVVMVTSVETAMWESTQRASNTAGAISQFVWEETKAAQATTTAEISKLQEDAISMQNRLSRFINSSRRADANLQAQINVLSEM